MAFKTGRLVQAALVLGLGAAALTSTMTPTYAGDGGAIAAGVIGGAALGALAGSAAAGAYAPPPPPPPAYYAPVDAPPPRCHRVFVRRWDPYEGAYVDTPRRVCDY